MKGGVVMSLGHYRLNAQKISPEARNVLFEKINEYAFMVTADISNPGCFEVFWDSKDDFVKSMNIPADCKVTVLCKPE